MSRVKPYQLGREARKVDPKLRVIANGDDVVNTARAESCAGIAVATSRGIAKTPLALASAVVQGQPPRIPQRGHVENASRNILANVFISTDSLNPLPATLLHETDRVGQDATAQVSLSQLKAIANHPSVRSISLGQPLKKPNPVVSPLIPGPPDVTARLIPYESLHKHGESVMVGIIDVEGFDFAHPDFLNASGKTRFECIWDQGAEAEEGAPYGYGRLITADMMNAAIAAMPKIGAPATELESQSSQVASSHGTHVASIAAGNLGVARKSGIAAVLISLGPRDVDPRRSFYDSTRIAHAVSFLLRHAGKRPISINVSLGTNGHAHDDSAPINRWIDHLLATHGRCVSIASGNAGQDKAYSEGDIGFVLGRIHTSGRISAAGLDADIQWNVSGRDGRDFSENELELWFSAQDRFAASLRTPEGQWIGPIQPLEFIENRQLPDGTFISIYNELYHAANGCNYIGLYLSPNLKSKPVTGVQSGVWTVRVHANEVRDGRYHGWIERDDPHDLPPAPGEARPLAFPSFFTEKSNVDNSSISTLACGQRVIAVANLDELNERINPSSSKGPTRDGRQKPDIAAPGTDIIAACGFAGAGRRWVSMTGTSMASPLVCGVAALMLATRSDLSAAQIGGIIQRTSRPLPGGDYSWQNDAGFGTINPAACVKEADLINQRTDRTKP